MQPLARQVAVVQADPGAGGRGLRDGRLGERRVARVGHADAAEARAFGGREREQRPRHVHALAHHANHQRAAAAAGMLQRRLQAAGGQFARRHLQGLHHQPLGARMQLVRVQSGVDEEFLERVQFLPLRKRLQKFFLSGFRGTNFTQPRFQVDQT